jgi:hypothetical protein
VEEGVVEEDVVLSRCSSNHILVKGWTGMRVGLVRDLDWYGIRTGMRFSMRFRYGESDWYESGIRYGLV